MCVLLTGGAGYIGSHMVLDLLAAGEEVVVLDNLSVGFRWALPDDIIFVEGDYGDATVLNNIFSRYRIDTIIHLAAKIMAPESVMNPLGYYGNNVIKSAILLEQAIKAAVPHFIFASSAAVYGERNVAILTENDPTEPINPYGRSKLMVEWMLEDVAFAHQINFAALRYFNVCGADPEGRAGQNNSKGTHLINVAVQAALGQRAFVEVFGTDYPTPDGSCIRDYIHVTDLVRANMAALKHLRLGGASITCNIGYGSGYSVLDVINTVKRVSGHPFDVRLLGRRVGDPSLVVASNHLARSELGWEPCHANLEEIIQHSLAWASRLDCHRAPGISALSMKTHQTGAPSPMP